MNVGPRIRQLRKEKKITLVELSNTTGVAQATLSRIETGVMQGTVDSHRKLAAALGTTLSSLYKDVDERFDKIEKREKDAKREVVFHTDKAKCEMLTANVRQKKMAPLLITVSGKSRTNVEATEAGVEKFYFMLEGDVTVKLDTQEYQLKAYETLHFDGSLPHHITNNVSKIARLLCVVSPPQL